MNKDERIKEGVHEVRRQLSVLIGQKQSLFNQTVPQGYSRGIDYYTKIDLPRAMTNAMISYKYAHGEFPDLLEPRGFNEKIVWNNFFGRFKVPESGNKLRTSYFITDELKDEISCPEVVWHSREPVLPDNDQIEPGVYYLKPNFGSGMHQRIKFPLSALERDELHTLSNKWMRVRYGHHEGEWWYNVFPREFMIERAVTPEQYTTSWYFYVFDGEIPFIAVVKKGNNGSEGVWLDGEAKKLPYQGESHASTLQYEVPELFDKAHHAATEIGKNLSFARVDFIFDPEGPFYLGEVTFAPGNGLTRRPKESDYHLGSFWNLPTC